MPSLPVKSLLVLLLVGSATVGEAAPPAAPPAADWQIPTPARTDPTWGKAQAEVAERLARPAPPTRAKKIILFIGDGMGITTITAARIFAAQQRAKAEGGSYEGFAGGEESLLSFEEMPQRALVKTYNSNAQVPDSAGTATAMMTGIKTRIGVLGIAPGQGPETCRTPAAFPETIGELARARGMGLGIVTTTRITHATPAAVYAHSPNRDWEGADRAYPEKDRASGCPDIATQLVDFRGGFDVALGGGRAMFLPEAKGGTRDDGRDLLAEWQKAHRDGRVLQDAGDLRALDPGVRGPVLGLFHPDHIRFHVDRDPSWEPSLEEMATFAVKKLEARGGGYFLMVEAGRIDHGHHLSNAYRALDETAELSRTVAAVLKLVDLDDTLVMVTADHSHVLTMAGYPPRGNDILGTLRAVPGGEAKGPVDKEGNMLNDRGQTMTTLGYRNGPFAAKVDGKSLSRRLPSTDPNFLSDKVDGIAAETHGGEDVALFAVGAGSGPVSGTIEQNSIFHIMAHALGWR